MSQELLERIRNCPTLPSLPAIAVQVLELAQRNDADIGEIGKIIAKDPALCSKILRTVNSSFYGRSQNVSQISQALVILGLQSVKTLVLGFSLVSNLTKTKARGFKHVDYWRRSIYAATAARSIAAKVGCVQQEESFLAALLMDIGMLVLDQVAGDRYSDIHSDIKSHSELPAVEMRVLGMTHAEVAGFLTQQWKLPPLLSVPVQFHHNPTLAQDPHLQNMARIINLAGRCADVFVDEQAAPCIADVRSLLAKDHNFAEADADALLKEIGERTREVASLFEINVGATTQYEAILKKANETLIELTLQSQHQATQLQQQNLKLQEQASKDGLTGLSNRAAFDTFIKEQFSLAVRDKKMISLLVMDLDKFKSINDTHGHPAGDAVLKAAAKILHSAARPEDMAARYGGEELVLVLPGTPRPVAAAVAESIRRAISARPIVHGSASIPVTASIGVATYEPGSPLNAAAHLIKAADLAVYNAKKSGRNCVKLFAIKPAAAA